MCTMNIPFYSGFISFRCFAQDVPEVGEKESAEGCSCPHAVIGENCEEILFNPNVFTEFKLAGNQEVIFATLLILCPL